MDVWEKSNQYCKAIINQLKINKYLKIVTLFNDHSYSELGVRWGRKQKTKNKLICKYCFPYYSGILRPHGCDFQILVHKECLIIEQCYVPGMKDAEVSKTLFLPQRVHVQWGERQMNRILIEGGRCRHRECAAVFQPLWQLVHWGTLGPASQPEMGCWWWQ